MFIFGVGWFAIWAAVNGFAHNPIIMSLGRALQGAGSGFTIPSGLAMITTAYPVGHERNKAVGVFGGTAAVGSVAGIFLGGILGSTIGKKKMLPDSVWASLFCVLLLYDPDD